MQLAHLALAQGRYANARIELDEAGRLGDPDAEEALAWLDALPFIEAGDAELAAAEEVLRRKSRASPIESSQPSSFFSAQNRVHTIVNNYLRGVIAARMRDPAHARAFADSLDAARGLAREAERRFAETWATADTDLRERVTARYRQ